MSNGYVAYRAFPGFLPDGDAELTVFDTAAEAWAALYEDAEFFDLSHVPEDEDDPEGPQKLSALGVALQEKEAGDRHGTVYDAEGMAWEVAFSEV